MIHILSHASKVHVLPLPFQTLMKYMTYQAISEQKYAEFDSLIGKLNLFLSVSGPNKVTAQYIFAHFVSLIFLSEIALQSDTRFLKTSTRWS